MASQCGPLERIQRFDERCQQELAEALSDDDRREVFSRQQAEYDAMLAEISQSGRLGRIFVTVHASLTALRQLRGAGVMRVDHPGQFVREAHDELSGIPSMFAEPVGTEKMSLSDEIAHLDSLLHQLDDVMSADRKTDKRKTRAFVPKNTKVLDLARRINAESPTGRSKTEIARELSDGNERDAQTLLRELRRFPNLLN